jgi:hypothetical protein
VDYKQLTDTGAVGQSVIKAINDLMVILLFNDQYRASV